MKPASVKDIKSELIYKSKEELVELCLMISKHKKENKELLTYLLFERGNETEYVKEIKVEMNKLFEEINYQSYYHATKGVRKVLRICKKYIRYSKNKETESEVLIYFCAKVKRVSQLFEYNGSLCSIYDKQLEIARKKINSLHEDLQYDFSLMIEDLLGESME
jgi:hypothetical protein